jgi:hypothetical protein
MMPDARPESETDSPRSFASYGRASAEKITGVEIAAIALSVLWLALSLIFFLTAPEDSRARFGGPGILSIVMTVFMPVAMIWASRTMREENQRLQAAIDGIRQAYLQQAQRGEKQADPSMVGKLEEIAALTRKTDAALTSVLAQQSQPGPPTPPALPEEQASTADQASLALGTPAEKLSPPLGSEDFIRALNFPENAEDKAGFDAMRRALRDRKAAQLIQASQDVLTLLSQEGIYMDDLRPDMARPEVWRQFAQGIRGREIAALGGVHDRTSLALTAGRMKQDPIFRDAAHHFLRLFDKMFAVFEPEASDAEISALGDTRTARAFMLLGRVAGTFD